MKSLYVFPTTQTFQQASFNVNSTLSDSAKVYFKGPRELTGAIDLISHYKLLQHHDFFCKRVLPQSISDSHYLQNVVGDTEIRKGDGMELDQLFQNASYLREASTIQPFDLDTLGQAFQLQETAPIDLSSADKGIPTSSGKSKESKNKSKKHKKHKEKDKDKDKEKDKEHKKHKHRHKDKSKDKDKEKKKDKSGHHDSGGDHSKKHHDKKRKLEGSEDITDAHKHKKSKVEEKFSSRLGISA